MSVVPRRTSAGLRCTSRRARIASDRSRCSRVDCVRRSAASSLTRRFGSRCRLLPSDHPRIPRPRFECTEFRNREAPTSRERSFEGSCAKDCTDRASEFPRERLTRGSDLRPRLREITTTVATLPACERSESSRCCLSRRVWALRPARSSTLASPRSTEAAHARVERTSALVPASRMTRSRRVEVRALHVRRR